MGQYSKSKINSEIMLLNSFGLLETLLKDRTTGKNIIWATDEYEILGPEYKKGSEIKSSLLVCGDNDLIKNRASKEEKSKMVRSKEYAEVFTPVWICNAMNNFVDNAWFCQKDVFNIYCKSTRFVDFVDGVKWEDYVHLRIMEITCGEAPFLISRYDAATGENIDIENRIGILDRKLRVICENVNNERTWIEWVYKAFQSTYGYEFQGDSLFVARLNLVISFEEYLNFKWGRKPTAAEYKKIIDIISWNFWQMDGLSNQIPYSTFVDEYKQLSIFDDIENASNMDDDYNRIKCKIYDWNKKYEIKFSELFERGQKKMKFDFIIGNPPYQEDTAGTSDNPIYHKFMDAAYELSDKVELITPARFLFNAGKTPKDWNQKILNDPHFKVLCFEEDSKKFFSNDIKGGIAITYHDKTEMFGPVEFFVKNPTLESIKEKVKENATFKSIAEIVYPTTKFNLNILYSDYPEYKNLIGSNGTEKRLTTNIFNTLPLFSNEKKEASDVEIVGLVGTNRISKYIGTKYIEYKENISQYKVLVSAANGTGAFGEALASPLIAGPGVGYTQTFLGIGNFNHKEEAESLLKYLKTKFARTMLGILKTTQHTHKDVWKFVPLQDFTLVSDIDWSESIDDIDQQLYKKYNLNQLEIEFINSKVRRMN